MAYFSTPLSAIPGRCLSLVGGGGKTTLLYALAEHHTRQGRKVLVATTTKIYQPRQDFFAPSQEAALSLWASGRFAVVGRPVGEKLAFPAPELWAALAPQADCILLEADGARHHPIKLPREGEPVLLPESDSIVAVMGLSALGQPLEDCCFGLAPSCGLNPAQPLTEETAARILSSTFGSRKDVGSRPYTVFLNQCDTPELRASAEAIAARLKANGVSRVIFSCFPPEERAYFQSISQRNLCL